MEKRRTILVLDDEPDVIKSVQDLLRLDYQVLGAASAAQGLEILRTQPVHVVMSDQRMPGMTGVDFLKKVRSDHPDAIRLLFTGYADVGAVIDAINHGNVYRYITKPWDPDELQGVIRQAVERYDLILQSKQLMEDIQAKNLQLEQANELKTSFIRVASHELRTPLTILIGSTTLARQKFDGDPLLNSVDRAGKWLQRLVDQLLTMLMVGQFEVKTNRTSLELAPLIRQCIDDVSLFAELRKLELQVEIDPNLGSAPMDPSMIRDAIDHLLINAIKFTPDGGRITLCARRVENNLKIQIRDTGAGIDAANLSRLFQPFFTSIDVSRHTSGTFEYGKRGLGLGLSVVKAFVEMHNGRVSVDSQPGNGATFTILLPASPPR